LVLVCKSQYSHYATTSKFVGGGEGTSPKEAGCTETFMIGVPLAKEKGAWEPKASRRWGRFGLNRI